MSGAYLGTRVTGLPTGHTIRLNWLAKRDSGGSNEQWLRAFIGGSGTVTAQVKAADMTNLTYTAYQQDLVLSGGCTEIHYWSTTNPCTIKDLVWTDLSVASPARLPIGSDNYVLRVATDSPAWEAEFDATSPSTQAFGDSANVGSAATAARRDHKHAMMGAPTIRQAAGVPSGAPSGTELPIAFDTTASTGGLYVWSGAAWVKASAIP